MSRNFVDLILPYCDRADAWLNKAKFCKGEKYKFVTFDVIWILQNSDLFHPANHMTMLM